MKTIITSLITAIIVASVIVLLPKQNPCLVQVSEAPIFAVEKDKDNNVYVGVVVGTTTAPITIASTSPMAKKVKVGKSISLCYVVN